MTMNSTMEQHRSLSGSSKSPGSPSSRPFLSVSVTDPVKFVNGFQPYIAYRVITKTNVPEYQGPEKIVMRRYSDFEWLHDCLCEKYKGIFIPSLPEKSAVEKFRLSDDFIEMRRQDLDIFINRIASHHELQQSQDLSTFLHANEETIEKLRSQKPVNLMQIFKDVHSKVSDVVLGKEKTVKESDPEYEKLKHYIFKLENHLDKAQKHSHCLGKKHRELGESWSDFGKAVKLLNACEETALGKASSELGTMSEILSTKLKEAHQLLINFEEHLKDCVRAVQSIKKKMAERTSAFQRQCKLTETLNLKEINIDKLMLSPSEEVGEAEHEYNELKAKNEQATKTFETIVKLMNEEIVRFREKKTLELGIAFHEFAKGQARLSDGIADEWRSMLPELEKLIPPRI